MMMNNLEQALARARDEQSIPADEAPITIRGGHKDVSARGSVRAWWFRMVWRDGSWHYVSSERLSNKTFLASDRRQTVFGDVWMGEIVVQHDRGGPVTAAFLVVPGVPGDEPLKALNITKRHDGQLALSLDGIEVAILPDPRR